MNVRGFLRRAGLATALLAASFWVVPNAFARSHVSVGIGIAAPGFGVSVGNCWRCGYWVAPPSVYYAPAYAAPVYYPAPATVYYVPRPAYYGGYGYYAPRYHHYRSGYYHDRGSYHRRGGYYHHRHH